VLAGMSAALCGATFAMDYVITTAVFAALTCTIGVLAIGFMRLP
jgi:hypothetical protein